MGALIGTVLSIATLIAVLSYQSFRLFEQVAREAGPSELMTRAEWLLAALIASAAMADTETRAGSRHGDQEADWLRSLPAPWWALQTAKFLEATLTNPAVLAFILPFLIGLSLHCRVGTLGVFLASALCLPLGAIITMLRWLVRAVAQVCLPLRARRVLRSAFNAAGLAIAIGYLVLSGIPGGQFAADVPNGLSQLRLPFTQPVRAIMALNESWAESAGQIAWFALELAGILVLGIAGLRWAYAHALWTAEPRPLRTVRSLAYGKARVHYRLGLPIWVKDSVWLLRHPDKLVSLVLAAGLASGAAVMTAQRILGPALTPAALGGMVFSVGVVMLGLLGVLIDAEASGLRLLATLPRSLGRVFMQKSLWLALLAIGATLPVLGYGVQHLGVTSAFVWAVACAFGGITLHAFLVCALALRTMRPDRPPSVVQAVLRFCKVSLCAAVFGAGFALPSPFALVGWVVLWLAFAVTFWQDAVAKLALALDPWTRPPQGLSPMHGIIAVVALRLLQVATADRLAKAGMDPWLVLTGSFALAAGVVLVAMVVVLRHWRVPDLRSMLGFTRGVSWSVIVREAALWSVPAVLSALTMVLVAAHWPWLGQALQESARLFAVAAPSSFLCLVVLTLLLAPAVEELLFRGVIYGRARSKLGVPASLLLSVSIFAVVHPRPAVLPIVCLGVCTALAYERSRSLHSAILVHVIYNAFLAVLLLST